VQTTRFWNNLHQESSRFWNSLHQESSRFWNNLHQESSKPKDLKPNKFHVVFQRLLDICCDIWHISYWFRYDFSNNMQTITSNLCHYIKKYSWKTSLQRIIVWRWNIFRKLHGTWLERHWLFTSQCYSYEVSKQEESTLYF
jgi:hypothetical protein